MRKNRIRREKSESEILVNGFIVARVNRKTEPEVAAAPLATASRAWAKPKLPMQNQRDSAT
jgi:hypothetical protein